MHLRLGRTIKMDSETSTVNYLPIEMVQSILQYLPVLDQMRCRRVCRNWRAAVDLITDCDEYWRRQCVCDHSDTYEEARIKCHPDLTWRELYKSLHLWNKVDEIKEIQWTEICRYPDDAIGVCEVNALRGSIIVQEEYKILYYNLDGESKGSFDTEGEQLDYTETESLIVYVVVTRREGFYTEMRIVKKINGQSDVDNKMAIPEVFFFIVAGKDVYYVPWFMDKTHVCVAQSEHEYQTKTLEMFNDEIISIGHSNGNLYVYLVNGEIYQQVDNEFLNITDRNLTIMEITRRYNFTNHCDEILKGFSQEMNRKIHGYRFYRNIAIFQCFAGVICLYNSDELIKSTKKCRPMLQFNLREKFNLKRNNKVSFRTVAGVDIIEKENGHIVLASIPKGLFAISLTH